MAYEGPTYRDAAGKMMHLRVERLELAVELCVCGRHVRWWWCLSRSKRDRRMGLCNVHTQRRLQREHNRVLAAHGSRFAGSWQPLGQKGCARNRFVEKERRRIICCMQCEAFKSRGCGPEMPITRCHNMWLSCRTAVLMEAHTNKR